MMKKRLIGLVSIVCMGMVIMSGCGKQEQGADASGGEEEQILQEADAQNKSED